MFLGLFLCSFNIVLVDTKINYLNHDVRYIHSSLYFHSTATEKSILEIKLGIIQSSVIGNIVKVAVFSKDYCLFLKRYADVSNIFHIPHSYSKKKRKKIN